jgi:NAD(P)-dependent dehydrogenase (short-subunit alcohol dehydrogenase family)
MKVVVVGASSGLGRCIGVGLAKRGNTVALLARRADRVSDAALEAGTGSVGIRCDVTDEDQCRTAIDDAATTLGGIDSLVYATGIGHLGRLADIDAATWQNLFATNVTGASVATAAALPHLRESSGSAIYLSSISASETQPWPGLGAYIVSKAALNKLVEAWRGEYPEVGFTRIAVGETMGGEGHAASEFAAGWDLELAGEMYPIWMSRNLMSGALLETDHLVDAVDAVVKLGRSSSIPSVVVAPRQ